MKKGAVLVAAAVEGELAGLIHRLEYREEITTGRKRVISGFVSGFPVSLLITGPGMLNAAQALTAAIEYRRPMLIIQTGCAGVFTASGLSVGDIGIATAEIDVHLGIESPDRDLPDTLPFPLLQTQDHTLFSLYPLHQALSQKAEQFLEKAFSGKNYRIRRGPFVTVSTITSTDRRAGELYRQWQPLMENMEGAAAAYLGILYGIACMEIRVGSNAAGKREREKWNLPLAFERNAAAVYEILRQAGEVLK
jgi:futalosine hydrolase